MNKEDIQIDKLTRELMKDGIEQPASSRMDKIMGRVMQIRKEEVRLARQMRPTVNVPSIGKILGVLAAYILVAIGFISFLFSQSESATNFMTFFMEGFPVIFTGLAAISFFFFFGQLDNWLWQKEAQKKEKKMS